MLLQASVDDTFLNPMLAGSRDNLSTHNKADLPRLVTAARFGPNTRLWHSVVSEGH